MKLNLNFDGKTLLKDWWKQIKALFQKVEEALNNEESERKAADDELLNNINQETEQRTAAVKRAYDKAVEGVNAAGAVQKRLDDEAGTRLGADNALGNRIDTEITTRREADNNLQHQIDNMAKQNNILDLYGEEVANTFKVVFPSGIPVPSFDSNQQYYGDYMDISMPADVQVYINDKQLSFAWDCSNQILSTNDYNYVEFQYDTETGDGNIAVRKNPVNNRCDGTRFIFGLYAYSNFDFEFTIITESPTGGLYELQRYASEYTSENADTTGETYTLTQEFFARRTYEDIQDADCFLDAVNAHTSEIKNMNTLLGTLSDELDAVNGAEG